MNNRKFRVVKFPPPQCCRSLAVHHFRLYIFGLNSVQHACESSTSPAPKDEAEVHQPLQRVLSEAEAAPEGWPAERREGEAVSPHVVGALQCREGSLQTRPGPGQTGWK